MRINLRKYGKAPYDIAVIHGGPGANGEMAPVAREISPGRGILEPLQTALSLEGQVQELKSVLEKYGAPPITLIGHSWGAWLVFILAAQHPSLVKKLILVGSGPFETKYAKNIMETRLSRLNEKDKLEVEVLMKILNNRQDMVQNTFRKFGNLISKADSYNPLPDSSEALECQYRVYLSVWPEAEELRSSGKLLNLGGKIQCPVVAIHGEYDPHPPEGVKNPLSAVIRDFRFILLKNCGHTPWIERIAKDRFYETLKEELS